MTERIGIFGGSFDPVHNGHVSVIRSFLNSHLLHKVWVVPASIPPHKQDLKLTAFHHRKKMLQMALEDLEEWVCVSDIENNLPPPSYTVKTLEFLCKKYPETLFFLCLGEDSLKSFNAWYDYQKILSLTTLVVAERPGFTKSGIPQHILEKAIFVSHQPVKISSTAVREFKEQEKDHSAYEILPDAVSAYIKRHQLYK